MCAGEAENISPSPLSHAGWSLYQDPKGRGRRANASSCPNKFRQKREGKGRGWDGKGRSGLPCKLFLKFVSLLDTSLIFVDVRLGSFETSAPKHTFFHGMWQT